MLLEDRLEAKTSGVLLGGSGLKGEVRVSAQEGLNCSKRSNQRLIHDIPTLLSRPLHSSSQVDSSTPEVP